jgi:hypothetical protein
MSEIPIRKRESHLGLVIPTLPALIFVVALLLTATFLSLVMSFMVSFRLGDMMARPNPFNNYELVWPGQTLAQVAEYARRTPKGYLDCHATAPLINSYPGVLRLLISPTDMYYGPNQPMTCMGTIEKGIFRSVSVTIQDDQVQELNLFSDYLQQDVLAVYWGVPDAITKGLNGESVYLHWDRGTYTATARLIQPYIVVSLMTIRLKP